VRSGGALDHGQPAGMAGMSLRRRCGPHAAGEEEAGVAAPGMHGFTSSAALRAACIVLAMVVAVSCG
jgi:hypothetical protein